MQVSRDKSEGCSLQSKALVPLGFLLAIAGVAVGVGEAAYVSGLCHPVRARSGWKFRWLPNRYGGQEGAPHCSPLPSPRERAPMCPQLLVAQGHWLLLCWGSSAAGVFPACLGMACCLRINNLTDYEGTLADTIVPVKSNCL